MESLTIILVLIYLGTIIKIIHDSKGKEFISSENTDIFTFVLHWILTIIFVGIFMRYITNEPINYRLLFD
jgi:hypothetical protein